MHSSSRRRFGSTIRAIRIIRTAHDTAHKVLVVKHVASLVTTKRSLLSSTAKGSSSCESIEHVVNLSLCQWAFANIRVRVQKRIPEFGHVYLSTVIIVKRSKGIEKLLLGG
ncbi:hypothetical protein DPV78_007166 [Talaromyces pinophilus]|nr:hypothetical protein DPV78_007166 [Talaromyces pinophilus]